MSEDKSAQFALKSVVETMLRRLIIIHSEFEDSQFEDPIPNRFLRNFFSWQIYLLQSFCQKSVERKPPKKYFFLYFVFITDLRHEPELHV